MKLKLLVLLGVLLLPNLHVHSQERISFERMNKKPLNKERKEGMIVGTIALENRKKIATRHSFLYNKRGFPKELVQYEAVHLVEKCDFKDDDKVVYLFNVIQPAGDYNFFSVQIFLNTGYMQSAWELPIEIPFTIEEGKVTYLGEITLNVKGATYKVSDKSERDRVEFKKRFPYVNF